MKPMTNQSEPAIDRTVDAEEVERFNSLAATWWDPDGPMWPLHRLNELRAGYIQQQISRWRRSALNRSCLPLAGLRVLDIGCGGGLLSEAMAERGAAVTGIDVAERNLDIARQHAREGRLQIDYRLQSAGDLGREGRSFDIVLNMEVVEHVADVGAFMSAACKLVRPGGMMFVSTINRNPLAGLVAIFGAEYVLGWMPKGTHRYDKLVKPRELESIFETRDFSISDRMGVRVNPITRRLHLTPREWINYMFATVRAPQ